MKNNIEHLYDRNKEHAVAYSLQSEEIKKVFETEKFMFCLYNENGTVQFHHGDKLNIGDIVYLQKVMNLKCDKLLEKSMFPDG